MIELSRSRSEDRRPAELFAKLFTSLLVFVYHCFDRVVIHGYLSGLSRPEQVVFFFRHVLGIPVVSKEVLSRRTDDYRNWVEAFARNHKIPIEWAEKGLRKEDHVLPALRRMEKRGAYGVYFIFKSMEQGRTFRITVPKYPYFYIRDEVLGPIIVRVASFFPFHATYWLNGHSFIQRELERAGIGFHKNDNAFLAVDDVAVLQAAADRLNPAIIRKQLDYWTLILGPKFSKQERAQMNLSRFYAIAQIEYCRTCLSRLLEDRLPQPVREVLALPAQRTLFQQPARLRPRERTRSPGRRAQAVPDHHRSLRRLPGRVPRRPRGFSAAPATGLAHHHRLGPPPRH
jgi:hypothetical protein